MGTDKFIPPPPVEDRPGGFAPPPPVEDGAGGSTPTSFSDALVDFVASPEGLIRSGLRRAWGGVKTAATAPGFDAKLGGGSEIIKGLGTAASPVGIGALIPAAVTAPAATAGGLVLGLGGAGLGNVALKESAKLLGAGPGASELAGDVGTVSGGALGGVLGSSVGGATGNAFGLIPRAFRGDREAQDALAGLIPYFGSRFTRIRDVANPLPPEYKPMEPFKPSPITAARMGGGTPNPVPGEGLQTGTILTRNNMRPVSNDATPSAPFRPNPRMAAMLGRGGAAAESEGAASSSARPSGNSGPRMMPGAAGSKKVEVQHLGDMRLPRNQPKVEPPPKLYDRSNRLIRR